MPYIDTHCHLNDPHFDGRIGEVLDRALASGMGEIIVPGWDAESSRRAVALAAEFPAIRAAVGLHPWFVTQDDDLSWLPVLLDNPRVVAVGEIGLDGAVEKLGDCQPVCTQSGDSTLTSADAQERVFRAQLALAVKRNLPALMHCRRRWDHLLPCLRETPGIRGVMHAFSGSRETLRELLDLGFFISFSGSVTRTNAKKVRLAAAEVPANRLLTETDAPAIGLDGVDAADVEPAHIPRIVAALAELRGEKAELLAAQIDDNSASIF